MHTSIIGIEVFHVANLVLQVILMSTVEVISVNVLCQRNACKKNNSEAKIVVSRELGEMISYLLNNIRNKCQRIFFFCQSVGFSKLFEGDVPNFQRMWYFAMEVSDVKWRILYTQTNTIKDMKVERVANKPNIHVWRRKNCRDERKLRGLDKRDRERKEWDASKNENRKILDYWIEGKNKVKIRWNNNIDHNINSLWVELNNWVSLEVKYLFPMTATSCKLKGNWIIIVKPSNSVLCLYAAWNIHIKGKKVHKKGFPWVKMRLRCLNWVFSWSSGPKVCRIEKTWQYRASVVLYQSYFEYD